MVGHTADHAVFVGFYGSNLRCAMVVKWMAAYVCGGGLGCCLTGFCGFPICWWLILGHYGFVAVVGVVVVVFFFFLNHSCGDGD